MIFKTFAFLTISLCPLLCLPGQLLAQEISGTIDLDDDDSLEASDLRGEIILESPDEKKDPYKEVQDATIAYFEALPGKLSQLKSSYEPIEIPTEQEITHLAYLYLFCSIKRGVCKDVIDAVLEIDIANSAVKGQAECPAMQDFWKVWVNNDLERRHSYSVKTGLMRMTTMFKQKVLPNYLHCKETIAKMIEKDPKQVLVRRYPMDKGPIKNIKRVTKMLLMVKEKIPNLPNAVQQ